MRKFISLILIVFLWQVHAFAEPEMMEPEMTEPTGSRSGFGDLDKKCTLSMTLLDFYKCLEKVKNTTKGDKCLMDKIRCHIKQRSEFAASDCAHIKDANAFWQCFQNNVKEEAIAQNPNINIPALLAFVGLASTLAGVNGDALLNGSVPDYSRGDATRGLTIDTTTPIGPGDPNDPSNPYGNNYNGDVYDPRPSGSATRVAN